MSLRSRPNATPSAKTARERRTTGFTSLEVIVSLTLLAIVILSTARASLASKKLAEDATETQRATLALRSAATVIEAATKAELTDVAGPLAPGNPLALSTFLDGQSVQYELPGWTAGDPIPDVLAYQVTVQWQTQTGESRSMELLGAVE